LAFYLECCLFKQYFVSVLYNLYEAQKFTLT
jgi:hypothetical protein